MSLNETPEVNDQEVCPNIKSMQCILSVFIINCNIIFYYPIPSIYSTQMLCLTLHLCSHCLCSLYCHSFHVLLASSFAHCQKVTTQLNMKIYFYKKKKKTQSKRINETKQRGVEDTRGHISSDKFNKKKPHSKRINETKQKGVEDRGQREQKKGKPLSQPTVGCCT